MITMRILIAQTQIQKEAFVSGGVFDGENFGLKAKKKTHKRTPQKCPKGPPEGKLGESASHHGTHTQHSSVSAHGRNGNKLLSRTDH